MVERTGVDERGAGPSHSCRAPPAGPPRVHSRQVPKDPRVHMDPALAATNAHTTYVETKPVMVAISLEFLYIFYLIDNCNKP